MSRSLQRSTWISWATSIFIVCEIIFSVQVHAGCEQDLTTPAHLHQDLDTYIAGMEKSSLQKAAYASLARPGKIVDLGAGSGISARDLAVLFPDSQVTGLDLDPDMVRYAQDHYRQSNLNFVTGNAEHVNFPENSLDALFMSSTAHHLTSYGSGEFDVRHVRTAIASAHRQLKPGGLFILRDFLSPDGPPVIFLELPTEDGVCEGTVVELSTACLFEKFAEDFRSSTHPQSAVVYQVRPSSQEGWRRYEVSLRDAVEFALHKDYRNHYDAEIREEYTFMSQAEFENSFRQAGFRVLHSAPIYNPWIVENRFKDKIRFLTLEGQPLPFPATNYVIAGEKIGETEGLRFVQKEFHSVQTPKFLKARVLRDRRDGQVFDLIERPHETIDVLPYFKRGGRLFILSKQGFPRPILTATAKHDRLSGVHTDGYVVEPLSFLRRGQEALFKEIELELSRRSDISPADILRQGPGQTYQFYTSPGLVSERTTSLAIPIRSRKIDLILPNENYSGFTSSGVLRPLEATQLLRSAQVGSLLDARMEIAVYNLLLDQKQSLGPWIGEDIQLQNSKVSPRVLRAEDVLAPRARARVFEEMNSDRFGSFLEVREGTFQEINTQQAVVAERILEYVVPRHWSSSVVSVLPVLQTAQGIFVGLERRHLPAVQLNEGFSNLTTNPAWRIPKATQTLMDAQNYALEQLRRQHHLSPLRSFELGGIYDSSKGVTPETVHPLLVNVEPTSAQATGLDWVRLDDLLNHRHLVHDGHLLVLLLRAAHALGMH